ncbi:CHAT domain-containing tetratricopeptide repeat protein [Nodularia sp. NIES-3585]|uniref:CHAT domain-containing tetratricopeptide repeat protein n=1 Tax=Nodularia sp. NIES-3585 TaxID=1973477 RepID=UPI000B5CB596|nr:tetratricopeptide repeat protein [Nodularia sp. NIES-3585]GAX37359.1 TPR domain protein [Nodularia sp. NIES-3585]
MNKRVKNSIQPNIFRIVSHLLPNLSRYSFTLLLGVILLSDAVGATSRKQGLQIAQQSETTQQDVTGVAKEKLIEQGIQLLEEVIQLLEPGTPESVRQGMVKLQAALKLWEQADDKFWQATTLGFIAGIYDSLGEKQQALSYLNQALPLYRALGDRGGEATTLDNIGNVYNSLGEKQQALTYLNQALPIFRALDDRGGEATTLNNIGSVYNSLGERQQALTYLNQALPLYRALGDRGGEATTLDNIGNVYNSLGEKQQALTYLNQALPIFRALDDRGGEATTLNNIGSVYNSLGEKQQALTYFNQALPILRTVSDRRGEATTLNNIGSVYSDLGEQQQALRYLNQALPLRRAVSDRRGEATTLDNIGSVYSDLGEKQQALTYYNQALPLRRAVSDREGEAITLNNIGSVYNSLGEKQQALTYLNQALPILRDVGDRGGEATILNNIGSVYNSLGEKQQALTHYNQALPLRRDVGDRRGEAATLSNIATVYFDLGEKQQALTYYNQALPLLPAVSDRRGEATTLNNLATVYFDLGEKQQALTYYNQALSLSRDVGDRGGEATTLNNLATVYFDLGEKQQALTYLNQALPLRRAVGDRGGEANTFYNIAFLERDQGNLQQALTQIQAAVEITEDLRTKIDSQELRTSYFATVQDYYQFYIDLLMQLHKQDPSQGYDALALHISERSRARGLVELLTEASADIRKDVDPKLLAEEQRLLQLIDAKEKQRFEIVNSPKVQEPNLKTLADKLQTEINDLLNQHKQLQTQIRTTSPKYADLIYPQPLTLSQIQQQLDPDTILLQYSLGKERSYLWAVTPDSIDSYELPQRSEIEAATQTFYKLLQDSSNSLGSQRGIIPIPTDVNRERNIESALKLSQMILSPVADKLGQKRLVIVADGALQVIPFAALPDVTTAATEEQVNYEPLLINHEIVHLPSMTAIATQRQALKGRTSAPKTLAVLADPVFSLNDSRVQGKSQNPKNALGLSLDESALKRAADNLNRGMWSRLPGTREEALAILKLVSPQSSLQAFDFAATFNWATNPELSQYRFLHFATHGFADPNNPELSGIVLSLVDEAGQPERGYLRLGDIFNLNFPADLVVLSACETGLGGEVSGEGLVGLTRGLMYAGAERLAVSLWKVDDRGTSELMQRFYQQMLQHGESPNVALRQAQLQMWELDNRRNPYFWSGFISQGEWR